MSRLAWMLALCAQSAVASDIAIRFSADAPLAKSGLAISVERYGDLAFARVDAAQLERIRALGIEVEVLPMANEVRVGSHRIDVTQNQLDRKTAGKRLHLLQFDAPARTEWLADLESRGIQTLQYYPSHAYLVWADAASLQSLDRSPQVRGATLFAEQWKLDASVAGSQQAIDEGSIFLYNSGSPESLRSALVARGVSLKQFYSAQPDGRFYRAIGRIDAGALAALAAMDEVVWIGREFEPQLDDEMANQTFARRFSPTGVGNAPGYLDFLKTIGVPWDLGLSGAGITWGVVDSGTDWDHPDLALARAGGADAPGCTAATLPGDDAGGHGSHVSGSVAGRGTGDFSGPAAETDANGYAYGQGVAPKAMLFGLRSIGCGSMTNPERVRVPMAGGARGSNNSWNNSNSAAQVRYLASEREYDILVRDGDFNTAANQQFSILFSAGNAGPNPSTLTGPHVAKNIMSVASSNIGRANAGNSRNVSSFSSRGPAEDGRVLPTITGVGGNTGSTRMGGSPTSCGSAIAGTNSLYSTCSGTSMSTPMVSGAAVLVHEWWGKKFAGAVPSPAMVKAVLINGAYDLQGTNAGSNDGALPIPNNDEGWGQVDLAYTFDPALSGFYRDQNDVITATGQTRTLTVAAVDTSKPLKITLVWTDAPGAVAANPALVNDLDLEVVNGGNTYRGNVFSAGASTTGGNFDRLNNVENVYINSPAAGATTITLSAAAINADALAGNGAPGSPRQDYALVCTNCREAGASISSAPADVMVCGASAATANIGLTPIAGFAGAAQLSVADVPVGLSASFAPTSVTGAGTSTLTLTPQSGLAGGVYAARVIADVSGGADDEKALGIWVSANVASSPALLDPADSGAAVRRTPTLWWSAVPGALRYRVEVSSTADFTPGPSTQSFETARAPFTLPEQAIGATRFWRVTALNACGASAPSPARSFTVAQSVCSTTSLSIPDGNATGTTQDIVGTLASAVGDLDLSLNAAHTSAGQLALRIAHVESGISARLYTKQNNCTGDDINGTFNDDGGAIIACRTGAPTISGSLLAQDDLARFAGVAGNGTWRLTAIDDATGDSGSVNQWCVIPAVRGDVLLVDGLE